ncbi:UNVERIFIED_CONTAM: Trafficking protein particle complex subunit [Sesamum calycinum]|uniref:Trafficking protein particle complex subunit n=1 Tax=Sesamum calycinum TaxID=2727403 RepID=A0AAW2Q3E6_9LAMI
MAPAAPKSGDAIFASVDRVNAELFTLTYGAIVRQLLTDLEEVDEVNKQLDQMGYNIGVRLVDEFLAKSNVSRCVDFRETAEVIAKDYSFLYSRTCLSVVTNAISGEIEKMEKQEKLMSSNVESLWLKICCFIYGLGWIQNVLGGHCICHELGYRRDNLQFNLEDNPLVDFVELSDACQGLHYCNILSGVVRGALEMVSMKTEVTWLRDMLKGDDVFELQVKLLKQIPEEYPYKDDE